MRDAKQKSSAQRKNENHSQHEKCREMTTKVYKKEDLHHENPLFCIILYNNNLKLFSNF